MRCRPAFILIAAAACGGGEAAQSPSSPPLIPITGLSVSAAPPLILLGQPATLTAEARAASGDVVPGAHIEWRSRNAGIATVTDAGRVDGRAIGITTIVASVGDVMDSATVYVAVAPAMIIQPLPNAAQGGVVLGVASDPPRFKVTDALGRSVPGVVVAFSDPAPGATVQPATVRSDSGGFVAVTRWSFGAIAGLEQLRAAAGGISGSASATVAPGPAAKLELIAGDTQNMPVGAKLPDSIVVRVSDAFGNPTPGVSVAPRTEAGAGSLGPAQATTDASGTARFRWTMPDKPGDVSAVIAVSDAIFATAHAFATGFRAKMVSASETHTCAIDLQDQLWCWGDNLFGQLGNGTTRGSTKPIAISTQLRFKAVSVAPYMTCAITTDGTGYCWGGWVGIGANGTGLPNGLQTPAPLATPEKLASISTGDGGGCALTLTATVLCWGTNGFGEAGTGVPGIVFTPRPIAFSDPSIAVATGGFGTGACLITTAHAAYCWGNWPNDAIASVAPTPIPVPGATTLVSVAVVFDEQCGVAVSGSLYCWRWKADSSWVPPRAGLGAASILLPGTTVSSVSGGPTAMCAIAADQRVLCHNTSPVGSPFTAVADGSFRASAITLGRSHFCAIGKFSQLFCWGNGGLGVTGLGNTATTTDPTPLPP